jgi:hypothetical protein
MKANSPLSIRSHDVFAVLWGDKQPRVRYFLREFASLTEKEQSLVNKYSQQPTAKRAFGVKMRS